MMQKGDFDVVEITSKDFLSILDIGIAVSGEKDRNKLLDMIIDKGMELTKADAGTLYILKDDKLHFKIMKTISQGVDKGRNGEEIDIPPVPLREENICAYCAIHKKPLNIEDVYFSNEFDFSGPIKYDKLTGYCTKSMMTIPLIGLEDEALGVLQLMNARDEKGEVCAFGEELEHIVFSLSSQAAIAVCNMQYLEQIKEQMWSFTEAMTEAIDARTPYNGSHTRNVAKYAGLIAEYINELYEKGEEKEFFSYSRKEQLVMGALLHDFGKMVIPTKVMNKATRLGDDLEKVLNRLEYYKAKYEIMYLKGLFSKEEYKEKEKQIETSIDIVKKVDGAGFVDDELSALLEEVLTYTYKDLCENEGEEIPYFTEEEKDCLRVKKGTLTAKEREIMESHVVMTERILSRIQFTSSFKDSAKWAIQHHECLNGKGYPKHLSAEDLGLEARILAVADICDALLATDRPYKKPMPKEKAFFILEDMAKAGNIDGKVVGYLKAALEKLG